MFLYWCQFVCFNVFIAYVWAIPLFSEVCLTYNKTTRKVQHLGDTGTAGAACRAQQAIFNSTLSQLPSSCHGASRGLSHSLNWRHAKKNRQGESPGRSLCSGESLLIICGRGLLGHLHSRGLVVGPWLWGIWTEAAGLAWWNKHWYVSQGAICSLAKWLNRLAWLD